MCDEAEKENLALLSMAGELDREPLILGYL
jgi:hypothetical protein